MYRITTEDQLSAAEPGSIWATKDGEIYSISNIVEDDLPIQRIFTLRGAIEYWYNNETDVNVLPLLARKLEEL